MLLSEQINSLLSSWSEDLNELNWYLLTTYPPTTCTLHIVMQFDEYEDEYPDDLVLGYDTIRSKNTVDTSLAKIFLLAIKSMFVWDLHGMSSLFGCSLICFMFIHYGVSYCRTGLKVIADTSQNISFGFSSGDSGSESSDVSSGNYSEGLEVSFSLQKQSSNLENNVEYLDGLCMIDDLTVDNEIVERIQTKFLGQLPKEPQVEIKQQHKHPTDTISATTSREELKVLSDNTKSNLDKPWIDEYENSNGSLMDLIEFKENIRTKQKKVFVHSPEVISSSKIILDNDDLTSVDQEEQFQSNFQSLHCTVEPTATFNETKTQELDPRLKAILVSNKQFDPVDFFDISGMSDIDFSDFDITKYLKERFQQDMAFLTPKFIDLLRFLVCNEYEGEKAGLFDYIDEIKSNLPVFIESIPNFDCSIDIIHLVRDIITYSEDDTVDLDTVNLFIDTIFGALDIIPLSTMILTICVVMCSLKITDFTNVFLRHMPTRMEVMLQCLKYYVCFNHVDSIDQKFILDTLLAEISKSIVTDNTIKQELIDIFLIFKEKNITYLASQLALLESVIKE